MRKLWLIALVLVAAFMLIVPVSYAQDEIPFPCGGLNENDCADLQSYAEANTNTDSATVDMNIDLIVRDASEEIAFNITGTSAFAGVAALTEMIMADPAALTAPTAAVDFIKNFDASFDATISLPEVVRAGNEEIPESIDLQIVLVDGVGYLNFDTLSAIPNLPMRGWVGLDLAALVGEAMESMPDMQSMGGSLDPAALAQLYDPAMLDGFVTIERALDVAAVFRYSFDFSVLMQSEAMQDMMAQQMEAMGTTLTDEQLEAAMAVYDGLSFTIEMHYDGDTQLLRQSNFNLLFDLAAAGVPDTSIELNASLTYSAQNDTVITAPDDAQIIPTETLLGTGMNS